VFVLLQKRSLKATSFNHLQ